MSRLVELNSPIAPITDRASTFGWVRLDKLCKKNGLRPIFGIELGVTASLNAKKPAVDYWTFLAKDSLYPLHQLFELATTQFRYEPLLTYEQAQACPLFKMVGYRSDFEYISPADDLFVGLSPSAFNGYLQKAKARGYQFIATSDNKYPRVEDRGLYEIICGHGASTQTYEQHIQSFPEWIESVKGKLEDTEIIQSVANLKEVNAKSTAVRCSFPRRASPSANCAKRVPFGRR
jgi:hypothetical protein